MSSVLRYKLNLAGQPASSYSGYLEADGPVGSSGPGGLGLATGLPPIKFDAEGNLKANDGVSDYLVAAAVGGEPGHAVPLSLTIMLNNVPVGLVRFDAIETSPGIVDIDVLYLQGKTQPATPEQLARLSSLLAEGTTLHASMISATEAATEAAALVTGIATAIKGLRLENPVQLENGGIGWTFVSDPTAITNATVRPGRYRGLVYDFTGGT